MPFVEADPEDMFAALEGQENVLDPEQEKAEAFYRQAVCPRCHGAAFTKRYNPKHAFADPNWIVARATLVCNACRCHFDPHSGLIVDTGGLYPNLSDAAE